LRFKLVIFDCDGVLIDSEPIANRVFRDLLESSGLKLTLDQVMTTFVGSTKDGCIVLASNMLGRPLPTDFGKRWDKALFAALRAVKPVAGVPELLAGMKVPFCVASNGNPDRMALALDYAGLMPWVRGKLFTASEVGHPKPAPDLFLYAAKSMGVAPADCAVVEDTPTGVQGGVAAGMTVFGYAAATHIPAKALRAEGAKATFTSMSELPELLERG
jgi:beta-phosphoglucomutase-like phosphatase (HAD superfamily)